MESARSKASSQELVIVKSKSAASRVEKADSRWNFCSDAKYSSIAEEEVSNAHMAVSGEGTDTTSRNVSIIGLKLVDALSRVSTQIEVES